MAFTAKYAGFCDSCEEPIRPGDTVAFIRGGDLVHAGCTEPAAVRRAVKTETCTTCWLIKPCGCEDGL